MIYVAFHLHAYQPPTQSEEVWNRVCEESYEPVIRAIRENPFISISLDITKSPEKWSQKFLANITDLHSQKRIELVNTAAYHYLLPLFPEKIILRQLNLNLEFYRDKFGIEGKVSGIFPPELAFSPRVATTAIKSGSAWVMADDYPFIQRRLQLPEAKRAPQNWIPTTFGCGVLLRSRFWSEKISWKKFESGTAFAYELLNSQKKWQDECSNAGDSYIILAVDFETFGHHLKDSIPKFLIPFFHELETLNDNIKPTSLDFIFNNFPKIAVPDHLQDGTWSTSEENLKKHIPFPLWLNPENDFHSLWYDFICYAYIASEEQQCEELISLLDKAFYSCTPWQYSNNNKKVASWCLPMFEKIIQLLPDGGKKERLLKIYEKIQNELKYQ